VKAAVWRQGSLSLEERPDPVAGPQEALLRPARTVLIETPLKLRGEDGLVAGCCFCGVVEEGSTHDASPPAGTLCLVDPFLPCRECPSCRQGLAANCPDRRALGLRGRDGGLAERVAVPAANLLPLPSGDDGIAAPLAVPVAAILQLGRRLGLSAASMATVLGPSPLSLLAAAVLRERCPRVRILSEEAAVEEIAARWSLRHRPLHEAGRRRDQDAVILAGSDAALLSTALGLLRPRGSLGLLQAGEGDLPPAGWLAALVESDLVAMGGGLLPPREGVEFLRRRPLDLGVLLAAPLPLAALRQPRGVAAPAARFTVIEPSASAAVRPRFSP
jgi:threonine dehydrogenase-like Zn-dependent dehydrogenase